MRGARTDASLPRYGVWSIARVTGGYRYEMASPHTMNGWWQEPKRPKIVWPSGPANHAKKDVRRRRRAPAPPSRQSLELGLF